MAPGSVPKIRLRDVHKSFGDQAVLRGVNLDIAEGEALILLGTSGSGKTVLLKCLLGLIPPDAGSVQIDGAETIRLGAAERDRLMRKIGVLFQNGALFDSLQVWQNVAFSLLNARGSNARAARRLAVETLALVGLGEDTAELMPAELSGGMQKRVALARAIALQPEILFLDSPTDGLDPIMTAIIDRLIATVITRFRVTALVITHDLASARRIGTRAALLDGGRIGWEGPIGSLDCSGHPVMSELVRASRTGPEHRTAKATRER
jgi:phospholipid/cholesterol/gamma-HCH transport system ATP-binding protein